MYPGPEYDVGIPQARLTALVGILVFPENESRQIRGVQNS